MTRRSTTPYGEMRADGRKWFGYDANNPIAGYYRVRLRSGGATAGARIWYGPPLDPITGEELDRSHRWQAEVNGKPYDYFDRIWPKFADQKTTEEEYRLLCAKAQWAEEHAPNSAMANPNKRVDFLTAPLPF